MSKRDAMLALCGELFSKFLEAHDFSIIQEALNTLAADDRTAVLMYLFWQGLEYRYWDLAEACIVAGYSLSPGESAGFGPLHDALWRLEDRPDVIAWLLDRGADIERRGINNETPLITAAHKAPIETIRLLVDAGANIDASTQVDEDWTALMTAARVGNIEAVRVLLECGADYTHQDRYFGRVAAQIAAAHGHSEIAALIQLAETNKLRSK